MNRQPIPRRASAPMPGLARTASALRHQQNRSDSTYSQGTLPTIPETGSLQSRKLPMLVGNGPRQPPQGLITGHKINLAPSGLPAGVSGAMKQSQRTSKISQKLVVLPSEPQTRPLPDEVDTRGRPMYHPSEAHSEGERMTKADRERMGFRRLTSYCVAEGFRMKLATAFLKREHGIMPRVFDEALYAVYHLPLLPGYGHNVNIRSSAPPKSSDAESILSKMSEAEEYGYDGTYFMTSSSSPTQYLLREGFVSSSPPITRGTDHGSSADVTSTDMSQGPPISPEQHPRPTKPKQMTLIKEEDRIAEIVLFDYGVVVFFGFEESQERDFLDDLENAMISVRPRHEDDWEVEECHYVYDPDAESPRIYNDFFTFKSHSHLLKISISHALAQSVLLGHYESATQTVLSDRSHLSPLSIPKQLASTGELRLRRSEALRLTGTLFKLRRDVNLVSNVLDTPELFWSEASLKSLYDACREYFEIEGRVGVLNERLSVTSDLLDIIHEHLNDGAMHRITWIIIWLIVVACLVEFGEVLARLVVTTGRKQLVQKLAQEEVARILDNMMATP